MSLVEAWVDGACGQKCLAEPGGADLGILPRAIADAQRVIQQRFAEGGFDPTECFGKQRVRGLNRALLRGLKAPAIAGYSRPHGI